MSRLRGVTLLELVAVVTLLGILAAVAASRYGRSMLGDFGAQANARQIALTLLQAQRAAIATGDKHCVRFDSVSPKRYEVLRRLPSGDMQVEAPVDLSNDVVVRVSHARMEFNFEGQALEPYSVRLNGAHRSWMLRVVPINGSVEVVETTPGRN